MEKIDLFFKNLIINDNYKNIEKIKKYMELYFPKRTKIFNLLLENTLNMDNILDIIYNNKEQLLIKDNGDYNILHYLTFLCINTKNKKKYNEYLKITKEILLNVPEVIPSEFGAGNKKDKNHWGGGATAIGLSVININYNLFSAFLKHKKTDIYLYSDYANNTGNTLFFRFIIFARKKIFEFDNKEIKTNYEKIVKLFLKKYNDKEKNIILNCDEITSSEKDILYKIIADLEHSKFKRMITLNNNNKEKRKKI